MSKLKVINHAVKGLRSIEVQGQGSEMTLSFLGNKRLIQDCLLRVECCLKTKDDFKKKATNRVISMFCSGFGPFGRKIAEAITSRRPEIKKVAEITLFVLPNYTIVVEGTEADYEALKNLSPQKERDDVVSFFMQSKRE